MVKNLRPGLAFLSGLLCALCFAFSAVSVAYADDWQENAFNPSTGKWSLTVRYNGGSYDTIPFVSSSSSAEEGLILTPTTTYAATDRFTFSYFPDATGALGLDGTIDPMIITGSNVEVSDTFCIAYFRDGTQRSVPVEWSGANFSLDSVVFEQAPYEIAFYTVFASSFDWGPSSSPPGSVGVMPTGDLLLGTGSKLSPTFPGSGLATSDLPHDAVSRMEELESTIHGGTGGSFDDANSMIQGLPDRLDEWGSSFSFVRLLTSNFIDRLPWLDTLLSVSLALGVIALLLNLSAWIGRASKK